MGRKPNQLIFEFFIRGAKLEDSSNRYEHTCKSCGEKFPKGRIDSMTTHVLKRCPAVSYHDRQRALQRTGDLLVPEKQSNAGAASSEADQMGLSNTTAASSHNMTALETLAEVSRRHLSSTTLYRYDTGNPKKRKMRPDPNLETARSFDEFVMAEHHSSEQVERPQMDDGNNQPMEDLNMSSASIADQHPHNYISGQDNNSITFRNSSAQQYAQASSDHTGAMVQQNNHRHYDSMDSASQNLDMAAYDIDPQLQVDSSFDQGIEMDSSVLSYNPTQMATATHVPSSSTSLQSSYLHDFSVAPGATRPKPRGRFSDKRRQEVRQIRSSGACVRCRMLKKACSGETPCNTCKSVVTSRLWKQPCIRKRLGEEFNLYSAGVHTVIAHHEANHIKVTTNVPNITHKLRATNFQDSSLQPAEFQAHQRLSNDAGRTWTYLPDMSIDMTSEIHAYVKRTRSSFVEHESSHFMRATLKLAEALVIEKHDTLLDRSVELWAATQILVDPKAEWNVVTVVQEQKPELLGTRTDQDAITTTTKTPPSACAPIIAHLRATIERVSATNAKVLVHELERRLLLRTQTLASNFETFLTSVILLNCVEKMCWLFQGWVEADHASSTNVDVKTKGGKPGEVIFGKEESNMADTSHQGLVTDRGPWHLDSSPASLVARGESIADILTMLLRVRGVPPRTFVDAEGIIRAAIDDSGRQGVATSGSNLARGEVEMHDATAGKPRDGALQGSAAAWLDSVSLMYEDVRAQQVQLQEGNATEGLSAGWNALDCRCWEMRFMGRVLI